MRPSSDDCPRCSPATTTSAISSRAALLAVPVLDGGALWRALKAAADGDAGVLSGGLSVSLLQLEADGFMTMTRPKSDTDRDVTYPPTPSRPIDRPPGRYRDLARDAGSAR